MSGTRILLTPAKRPDARQLSRTLEPDQYFTRPPAAATSQRRVRLRLGSSLRPASRHQSEAPPHREQARQRHSRRDRLQAIARDTEPRLAGISESTDVGSYLYDERGLPR